MKKQNIPFKLSIKDLKKIQYICQAFEELCKAVILADILRPEEELEHCRTLVNKYNSDLERGGF